MTRPKHKKTTSKFENNWLFKSLESLEKDYWSEPEFDSHLVRTCHQLRKKQLKDFSIEDLRIMIGQNIGLRYLISLAIEALEKNILAEGDYYEGDLLKSVLTSDVNYWIEEPERRSHICQLFNDNMQLIKIEAEHYNTGREILKAFDAFEKLHKVV